MKSIQFKDFPGCASGKELACQCRRHKRCGFNPWVGKIPWRRKWQATPVFLPGKSHGQRSLVGYKSIGLQRVGHDRSNLACKYFSSAPATFVTASIQALIQILHFSVVHIHNGVLLSHKKEYIGINSNEVDETGGYYTE